MCQKRNHVKELHVVVHVRGTCKRLQRVFRIVALLSETVQKYENLNSFTQAYLGSLFLIPVYSVESFEFKFMFLKFKFSFLKTENRYRTFNHPQRKFVLKQAYLQFLDFFNLKITVDVAQ